jgi:hypothetical protein
MNSIFPSGLIKQICFYQLTDGGQPQAVSKANQVGVT